VFGGGEERPQGQGTDLYSETKTADLTLRMRFSAWISRHVDGGVCVGINRASWAVPRKITDNWPSRGASIRDKRSSK
jgi:hypothetical protein